MKPRENSFYTLFSVLSPSCTINPKKEVYLIHLNIHLKINLCSIMNSREMLQNIDALVTCTLHDHLSGDFSFLSFLVSLYRPAALNLLHVHSYIHTVIRSMTDSRKRAHTDSDGPEDATSNLMRQDDLWFDDGSVVLKVQTTLYRVHRSTLTSHSTVFKDMFGLPQPAGEHAIEGCPIIDMPDKATDFSLLLKAIYDPK